MKHSKDHYRLIDLLTEAGVTLTATALYEIYGEYKGRKLRYIEDQSRLEIGDDNLTSGEIQWTQYLPLGTIRVFQIDSIGC